ncbi:MAG: hypothetical protein M0C28_25660 [Candidatus Moduliflexus flocculans]|nr:hypothetical protein [Candidatus Moduliflexus flocculans]
MLDSPREAPHPGRQPPSCTPWSSPSPTARPITALSAAAVLLGAGFLFPGEDGLDPGPGLPGAGELEHPGHLRREPGDRGPLHLLPGARRPGGPGG